MFIYFAELFISVFVWEPVLVQACVFLYCASVDLNGGLHGSRRQSEDHATFMYFRAGQRCCSAQLHKHWVTVLAFLPAAIQKYVSFLPLVVGRIWSWFRNHWSGISAPQNLEGGRAGGSSSSFFSIGKLLRLGHLSIPTATFGTSVLPIFFLHGSWVYQRGCSFLVTCAAALCVLLKACSSSSLHILQTVCPIICNR